MKGAGHSVKAMVHGKKKKVDLNKPAKLFQGSQSTFQDQEQQAADMHVVEVYNAFKTELSDWFKKDPVRRNDVEVRGDMADYLTDMYLSKKLDPLPPSKVCV